MPAFRSVLAVALLGASLSSGCLGQDRAGGPAHFVWQAFQAEVLNEDVLALHLVRTHSHVSFDGRTHTAVTPAGDAPLFTIRLLNQSESIRLPGDWISLDALSWEVLGYGPDVLRMMDERRWDESGPMFIPFVFVHAAARGQLMEGQFNVTLRGTTLQVSCTTPTECIVQGPAGGQRWQDGRWQTRPAETYRYTFSREGNAVFAIPLHIEAQGEGGPWRTIWLIDGLQVFGSPLQGRNVAYSPQWTRLGLWGNGVLPDGDPATFPYPLHQAIQDAKSCIGPNCDPAVLQFFLQNPDAIPRQATYLEWNETPVGLPPHSGWQVQFQATESWMNITIDRPYPTFAGSAALVTVALGDPFHMLLAPISPEQVPPPQPQIDLAQLRTLCGTNGPPWITLQFGVQNAKGEVGAVPQRPHGLAYCELTPDLAFNLYSGSPSILRISSRI